MPARKLAGAAIAAASNSRLMVIPPDVMLVTVMAPLWAPEDSTASLTRVGACEISTGPLAEDIVSPGGSVGKPAFGADGKKPVSSSSSPGIFRPGIDLDFI